jgi:hypothetical protein
MTEITDEQRRAYESLSDPKRPFTASEIAILAPLLPSELTNPQPELPTEPGRYVDRTGNDDWLLHEADGWFHEGNHVVPTQARPFAPFRRLVPERPQVTVEQVAAVYDAHYHPSEEAVDALFALVNGADQ